MTARRCAAVLIVVVIGSGCSSTKKIEREYSLTSREVLTRARVRDSSIATVRGAGRITIESPETSASGSFAAEVRKPDSAKVELTGPFGVRVGTLALTRQEVVFYDWRANTATVGTPDAVTLRSILRINLRFDEILQALTGDFLPFVAGDSLTSFTVREGSYVLLYAQGDQTREIRIDGDTFIVTSYRLLSPDGTATFVALASRPDEVEGIQMPTLVRIVMPKERRSLTVAYSRIRLNETVNCFFDIPREAEILRR